MFRNIIALPSGREISSGAGETAAIKSLRRTACVNSGTELTPGSVCAAMVEGELMGEAPLTAGMEVTLYKEDETGQRRKVGLFTLEAPVCPTPGRLRFTGYDRITKLDVDMTAWLKSLTGWPYTALDFARMVCTQCGVTLRNSSFANGDYQIPAFSGVYTARQLIRFIAELAGAFCRADEDGNIFIEYYNDWGVTLTAADCFQLSHADYAVEAVDAVRLRLGEALCGPEGENAYVISGNPLLPAFTDGVQRLLDTAKSRLPGGFVPCQLEIPANFDIQPGHRITVTDREGFTFQTLVMEKVSQGQKDTLKCTGSPRRSDPSALYGKSASQIAAEAVQNQSQADIWGKLTNFGALQGLYIQDGKLYINAELVQIVNLVAGVLRSRLDASELCVDGGKMQLKSGGKVTAEINNNYEGHPKVYLFDFEDGAMSHRAELTPHHFRLGGSGVRGSLVIDMDMDGTPRLGLGDVPKRLRWQPNGDGSYTLTGN